MIGTNGLDSRLVFHGLGETHSQPSSLAELFLGEAHRATMLAAKLSLETKL